MPARYATFATVNEVPLYLVIFRSSSLYFFVISSYPLWNLKENSTRVFPEEFSSYLIFLCIAHFRVPITIVLFITAHNTTIAYITPLSITKSIYDAMGSRALFLL